MIEERKRQKKQKNSLISLFQAYSHSSSIAVIRRDDSDPTVVYFDISLVDDRVPSFHRVIVELKSALTTQVQPIAVLFSSGISQPPGNTCPGPSCPVSQSDDFNFGYILYFLFTIVIALLLILLCRGSRQARPVPRGVSSPYGQQTPYPDGTRTSVDSFAGTPYPYNRSDVSPSRRRPSPISLRRTTPGSSPKLFSVKQ